MDLKYIILLGCFIYCLIGSFAVLAFISSQKQSSPRIGKLPLIGVVAVLLPAMLATVYFYPLFYDFITPMNTRFIVTPLVTAAVLTITYFFINRFRWQFLSVTVLAAVAVFSAPSIFQDLIPGLPLWLNQIIALCLWVAITFSLRILNGIHGLANLEVITISLGLFLLSFINGIPVLLGIITLCLCTGSLALLAYNWYPAKLNLSGSGFDLIGFILAWLMLYSSAEGLGSNIYILSLYLICEVVFASLKKITFMPEYADIRANTIYYQANISGLSPVLVCNYAIRLNIILILFAIFQLFAPNFYSLPILCTVIALWNLMRLRNWESMPGSLKEINRQFVTDFKDGLDNLKKNLRKDE